MRVGNIDSVIGPEGDELLTTGEAAKLLGSSRQHVVDLCDRGDLPFVTTGSHRRILRSDVEEIRARTDRMTRDQRRSLRLGYATAGKLAMDPTGVVEKGRRNLAKLRMAHPRGASRRWLDEWEELLHGPVDRVLEALTSRSPRARELRQNSPFAGALTDIEREHVLAAFNAEPRGARR
jgi:excisionase family DNA binding protein